MDLVVVSESRGWGFAVGGPLVVLEDTGCLWQLASLCFCVWVFAAVASAVAQWAGTRHQQPGPRRHNLPLPHGGHASPGGQSTSCAAGGASLWPLHTWAPTP